MIIYYMEETLVSSVFFIVSYINQMIAEYNVKCEEGTTAYIQFDALDLEPNNCYDGSGMK